MIRFIRVSVYSTSLVLPVTRIAEIDDHPMDSKSNKSRITTENGNKYDCVLSVDELLNLLNSGAEALGERGVHRPEAGFDSPGSTTEGA